MRRQKYLCMHVHELCPYWQPAKLIKIDGKAVPKYIFPSFGVEKRSMRIISNSDRNERKKNTGSQQWCLEVFFFSSISLLGIRREQINFNNSIFVELSFCYARRKPSPLRKLKFSQRSSRQEEVRLRNFWILLAWKPLETNFAQHTRFAEL